MIERFAAAGVRLVCPLCRRQLRPADNSLACSGCERAFPVVSGIPDLRLFPDRFLSQEADRAKGLTALERAGGQGFESALRAYWAMTPELEPKLARGHIRRQLSEISVGAELLDELARRGVTGSPLLDLGCGSGGLLAAAAERRLPVVGVDAAFRWLLIGRERLRELGREPYLVAANAEALPFEDQSFPAICANDLLEHLTDPAPAVSEIARVLDLAGAAYIATNNRYSLLPEPHVRLPGVGWLPRAWQPSYVRLFRRHSYDKVRLLGVGELQELLRKARLDAPIRRAPLFNRHLDGINRQLIRLVNQAPWPAAIAPRISTVARRSESVG